jgi:hypothetical protein
MPIGEGDNFRDVIDIINETTLEWQSKDKGLTMKTTKINEGDEYYNLIKKEKAKTNVVRFSDRRNVFEGKSDGAE